jgi:hypothetical protein
VVHGGLNITHLFSAQLFNKALADSPNTQHQDQQRTWEHSKVDLVFNAIGDVLACLLVNTASTLAVEDHGTPGGEGDSSSSSSSRAQTGAEHNLQADYALLQHDKGDDAQPAS